MKLDAIVEDITLNLLRMAATVLPLDVENALKKAHLEESSNIGKINLKMILENIELAKKTQKPICQDTGTIYFYIEAGSQFKGLDRIEGILCKAVRKGTAVIPLRPNALNPFTNRLSKENVGRYIPYFTWKIVGGRSLKITVLLKGGGSENVCSLKILKPNEGLNGVKKFVLESVLNAGGMPCPPCVIGVGIGGGADIAMSLAKKAILKPLKERNPNNNIANLESELLKAINRLGIGPMGLGGDTTALDVKIEYAYRHPASYPVAVAFQCWAARRATALIHPTKGVHFLTHKV